MELRQILDSEAQKNTKALKEIRDMNVARRIKAKEHRDAIRVLELQRSLAVREMTEMREKGEKEEAEREEKEKEKKKKQEEEEDNWKKEPNKEILDDNIHDGDGNKLCHEIPSPLSSTIFPPLSIPGHFLPTGTYPHPPPTTAAAPAAPAAAVPSTAQIVNLYLLPYPGLSYPMFGGVGGGGGGSGWVMNQQGLYQTLPIPAPVAVPGQQNPLYPIAPFASQGPGYIQAPSVSQSEGLVYTSCTMGSSTHLQGNLEGARGTPRSGLSPCSSVPGDMGVESPRVGTPVCSPATPPSPECLDVPFPRDVSGVCSPHTLTALKMVPSPRVASLMGSGSGVALRARGFPHVRPYL